jgi:hypothetical protein
MVVVGGRERRKPPSEIEEKFERLTDITKKFRPRYALRTA